MRRAGESRERARGWPGFDAVASRVFYDPFWRPGLPRLARRKAVEAALRFVDRAASDRSGARSRPAWQELSFKLHAFALFSQVDRVLSLRDAVQITVSELVEKARSLDPDEIPWLMEGIGEYVTQRLFAGEEPLEGPFDNEDLPPWSLGTLHTGLGMALASRCLAAVDVKDPDNTVARNVDRFLSLCDQCSRPGYTDMAIESLGFVLRFLHPQYLASTDDFLRANRPASVGPLWHGVGRALYFLPSNLIPGRSAPWRAVAMAEREAPHEVGRQNLLAGLAWPILLITWHQPRILEAVLAHHADLLCADDCFCSGLGAAMVMWVECTGGETRITELLDHRPQPTTPKMEYAWEALVRKPCLHTLTRTYPRLKKEHRLDEIFHYPLPVC